MLRVEEIEALIANKILELTGKKIVSTTEELVESGVLTSITMAELAVELEKTFSITLSFMDVSKENFATTEKLQRLVTKKLQDAV